MLGIKINFGDQKKIDWSITRRHIYILLIFIFLTSFIFSNNIRFITFSNENERPVEFNLSSYYNNPMPCIEPYCHIQCYSTYGSTETIIRKDSLTEIQQEHLMIDLGEDVLVQKLISSIPSSKVCRLTNETIRFYPIVFGFIESYFPKSRSHQILIDNQIKTVEQICLPRKTKAFSDLIPGNRRTYKFNFETELDYRRAYSSAYFALTMKKAGWDCNRHYEILTSGTIPYFDRLDQASQYTLSLLPKSLLYAAQKLEGVNRSDMSIDRSKFNIEQYYLLLHRLLYYAKHRLTTVKIVEYILKVIDYSEKHSVLFISHYESDYLKDFMLHGFTSIFKENLHVFQPPRYLYDYPVHKLWTNQETERYFQHKLYGMGYGYKLSLKDYKHLYERDKIENSNEIMIENNIRMKKYSLIVFGSILRENRFYSLVKHHYDQSKIVLIDGEDEGKDKHRKDFINWGMYFLREIPDDCHLIV